MTQAANVPRSRWLAARSATQDPRWRTACTIKLRTHPICQLRVCCQGAAASKVAPLSWSIIDGSLLNPQNLQSVCAACHQWKLSMGGLRVHP